MLGDKAYSSRAIRSYLRRRRIIATIPEPADQAATECVVAARGRPPAFDPESYKQRNIVERAINKLKGHRARGHAIRQARLHVPRNRRRRLDQDLAA